MMDDEEDTHILCRLEIQHFEREIAHLKERVTFLQQAIDSMWRNEVVPQFHHIKSREYEPHFKEKWRFYHEHKNAVIEDLCKRDNITHDKLSWVYVKKETDRLWEAMNNKRQPT